MAATQEIGSVLDDFALPDVASGRQARLADAMSGKRGAVVLFWSGICSHCVRYDGYFNGFQKRYPEIALLAVASRHGETPGLVRSAMEKRDLIFPILYDEGGNTARAWFTQQTPRVFLVDGSRKLFYRGAIDNFKYPADPQYEPYLDPAINAYLSGLPVPKPETASFGCAIMSVYYILPKAL